MCIWYVNCLLHGKFKNKNIAKTNGAVINFLLFFTFSSRFQIFQTNHFIFTNSKKIIIIMYRFKIRRTKQNYGQIKFNCIHLLLKSEIITITKSNLLKTWMYTFNVRKSVLSIIVPHKESLHCPIVKISIGTILIFQCYTRLHA